MTPRLRGVGAGIALAVTAYACFSVHDATVKWLVASLPVWQVLFVRSSVIVLGSLAIGRGKLVDRLVTTPLKKPLLLRGALTLCAWLCYYSAARGLGLAELTTLYFSAPLIVTALSAPLLGERVTWPRWLAVGTGFLGVIVACNPTALHVSPAIGLVLLAAMLWGYGIILMRQIARRETSLVQMCFGNLFFAIVTGTMTLFTWTTPTPLAAVLLLGIGIFGGLGQFCLFEAARHAPASLLATFEYSALIWAFAFGYLIWHDIPPGSVFIGALMIIGAGLLLVLAERRRARPRRGIPVPPPAPP
jgi:drug/metabolite transporter (DMT)-like permease